MVDKRNNTHFFNFITEINPISSSSTCLAIATNNAEEDKLLSQIRKPEYPVVTSTR